ncbi:MAG TPA: right-handed parallel beta-helix repeat-containing protein [Candidatus Acidoferrales bacterium]|nr:right-handed parallel beta-helix repeat-containing protein [Candidatus Acidoferrales bacterium]
MQRLPCRLLGFSATVIVVSGLLSSTVPSRGADLVSCAANGSGGDLVTRGFYVPDYPGITVDTVTLHFSASVSGFYWLDLTVTTGAYNGTFVGFDEELVYLDGNVNDEVALTFSPSATVVKGSTVCFAVGIAAGPSSDVYFDIGSGCSSVIETQDTTPPLSTFRRDGMGVLITGEEGTVTPGWSIQAAINAALPGETVNVGPGTYHENLVLKSGVNVVGSGWSSTILQGNDTTNVVQAWSVTNVRFAGFTITGSGTAGYNVDNGVDCESSTILLEDNEITANVIGLNIYSGSPIIRNNIFVGNGCPSRGCNYESAAIWSGYSTPVIDNNLIVNNTCDAIYINSAPSAGQIINNTIANNEGAGVNTEYGDASVIKNNILTGNTYGIAGFDTDALISYNDVWGNTGANYYTYGGPTVGPGPGDISSNPQFDPTSPSGFGLATGSPCIHAGDPNPLYNNPDGTRNTMGAFGGPNAVSSTLYTSLTSGFVFTSVGNIPTTSISTALPVTGLANVDPTTASALAIPAWSNAPFGGQVQLHGLFGADDDAVTYYRILAAPWSGSTPPALSAFVPVQDPLSKVMYVLTTNGLVASLVNVGPDLNGLYLRTDLPNSGYWTSPDLKLLLNTLSLQNTRYDFICQGFTNDSVSAMATLPTNNLSRITLWVDNNLPVVNLPTVLDEYTNPIATCGIISLATGQQNLQFQFTAYHPSGFLSSYSMGSYYGANSFGGYIAEDQYSAHAAGGPLWYGEGPGLVTSNSQPAQLSGQLSNWQSCAYQFELSAWARTTDGVNQLYWATYNNHFYLDVGNIVPGGCLGDLNGDGRVDGLDLYIFATRFGTNCVQ